MTNAADAANPRPTRGRPLYAHERTDEETTVSDLMRSYLTAVASQEWIDDGACIDTPDPDAWFPSNGAHGPRTRRAIAICRSCDVAPQCLAYALNWTGNGGRVLGIWGGTSALDRQAITSLNRNRNPA